MRREEPYPFHLVEDWVVTGIDLIPPIDVPDDQEGIQSSLHQLVFMGRCMGSQQVLPDRTDQKTKTQTVTQ